jgi:hypothetical protein
MLQPRLPDEPRKIERILRRCSSSSETSSGPALTKLPARMRRLQFRVRVTRVRRETYADARDLQLHVRIKRLVL